MHKDEEHKIKNKYLYLPVWIIIVIMVVCTATGIFVGSRANKSDHSAKPEKDTAAVDNAGMAASPKTDESQWNLILVNPWNRLPDDYEVKVTPLEDGQAIDERAYSDLQNMLGDCRSEGLNPVICSSYRTMEKQKRLFKNKVDRCLAQGYSEEEAEQKAAAEVAVPGTSEHQLGLALDIVDRSNQMLDESQEDTEVQKWLMKNSWKYGFILRYPTNKSSITGIIYEPWHYRYVGKTAAKEIYDSGICLEEYLNNSHNSD